MKIGLVLAGGGGKGAYQLGVWKALKEFGVDKYIKVLSGTSVGAINAALFAQNDLRKAEMMWNEVDMETLIPLTKIELIKKGMQLAIGAKGLKYIKKYNMGKVIENGDVPTEGFIRFIDKYLDTNKIKDRGVTCYASCTEMPDFNVKYFKINNYEDSIAKNIILGSASLPLIYKSSVIDGKRYLDGGMVDNIPIKPVYDEGCDIIIVVLLSQNAYIDKKQFPNAKIIEISPSNLNEGVIGGVLNLDHEAKRRRINEGYLDAVNTLGAVLYLKNFSRANNVRERHYKVIKAFDRLLNTTRKKYKNVVKK